MHIVTVALGSDRRSNRKSSAAGNGNIKAEVKGRKDGARLLAEVESVGYDRAMAIKRVCVYCASSRQCDSAYHDAAARLGRELARNKVTLVYGGGSVGSMGHLADAALAEGGRVIGVLPRFMYDLQWGRRGL